MRAPVEGTFWIEPGRLLAGRYAGGHVEAEVPVRLQALADAGITLVVDLTEAGEPLAPYETLLPAGLRRLSVPVRDFTAPPLAELERALTALEDEFARGGAVLVHCRGGCGRTGAVVASWLVLRGLGAEAALERYAELSRAVCGRRCPETDEQLELVRAYAARLGR